MFDFLLDRRRHRNCAGLSRRDVLKVGTLGPLGLTLADVLRMQSASAGESSPSARAKSVILIFLGGGLSHHDSFDLKPEAPEEIRGKYSQISTNVPGLQIGEKLPLMSQAMDKVALIRSGCHNNDHHETATNWVLSGKFGTAFGDWPAIGAVVAHESGFQGSLPPYVAIPRNPSFTWELGKSVWLGGRYESFKAGDPNDANYQVRDLTPVIDVSEKASQRRQELLKTFDTLQRTVEKNDQLNTYSEFQKRAAEMILSAETQSAFDMNREKPELRDAYGRNTFGQSCLLARRLAERGTKFITINYGGWDHHGKIFEGLERKLPEFDQGLSALLNDMHDRGLFQDTLLAVFGEFGRTPMINKDAGRDHWGRAGSLLFAGAGVKPGQVIGATDKHGSDVTTRPVSPADVAFTIYQSLGIDPHEFLRTPEGRPVAILDEGENIDDLYK